MLKERDKKYVWHPYTQMKNAPDNIVVKRAKGALFWDENEKEFIDAVSSWWVNVHGHSHPLIAERIYEQFLKLEHIIFAGCTHEPAVNLAEKLIELTKINDGKVFYTDNGSTAVEVALKMAIQYFQNTGEPKKKRILALEGAYHGDTFGSMSVSQRSVFTQSFNDYLFEVDFLPFPDQKNIENFKKRVIEELEKGNVAAFIFEPLVQGAGGMKMYPAEVLEFMINSSKKYGALSIADEVMTGFGRTGKMFAFQHTQSLPDIICLSKGITGGCMPLGVTISNKKVYDSFLDESKQKTLFHGHSFTANPLSCTASLASIEIFEEKSLVEYQSKILDFYDSFSKKIANNRKIENLRKCGTILAFDIKTDNKTSYLNNIRDFIYNFYIEKGLMVRPLGNVIYFMPPYVIEEKSLQKLEKNTLELIDKV
ncbi:MAG: adenosylmethionine--8-amino-7-oxononanoate transaminase [Chitinophagaceae bacterium]|nr:MAG: adenosylmethionine--8-amino-7-oxononanoate transaminase [Chitinophagaceae bacterium]